MEELDWSAGEVLSALQRLEIDDQTVLVGDPLSGHKRWPRGEFEAEWLGVAIVVRSEGNP